MKREPFNIKFKSKIIAGKAKLTLDGCPVRIICWDRKGTYPILGLKTDNYQLGHESIIEISDTGTVHIPNTITMSNGLYVEYDPIGFSKQARVAYSLLKSPCIEKYMRKYGYEKNEEKCWHWNAIEFANTYAKSYTNELHNDLKADGRWEYDDDYDWE